MMENLKKVKKKEKLYMYEIKINIMKVIGKMIHKMDSEFIVKIKKRLKDFGLMEN